MLSRDLSPNYLCLVFLDGFLTVDPPSPWSRDPPHVGVFFWGTPGPQHLLFFPLMPVDLSFLSFVQNVVMKKT